MTTHSETTLLGVIKRISFQSSDTGFTVASLSLADHSSHIIVGEMPGIHVGETLSCTGHWTTHPVHGPQFSVTQYSATLPTTLSGIESYLSSGVIKGIGPVFAKRIVGLFGSNTLDIIEEDPTQLRKVSGLGKAKCDKIIASLTSQRAFQKTLVFLHSLGLSTRMAQKVYQFYGDETVAIVSKNPYQLSQDVWGIGFVLADRIAKSCDISHESEERLKAGIRHVLSEKSLNGHTCFPEELLLEASSGLLSVSTDLVVLALKTLLEEGSVVSQTHRNVEMIFLASYYQYERGIISHLERLSSAEMGCSPFVSKDDDALMAMIHRLAQTHEISLSNSQTQALFATLTHKLMILTGGPGTGKTTLTRLVCQAFTEAKASLLLAAPTGRAAKRLTEVTGIKATTIHSLLSFDFQTNGFTYTASNPLSCDLLIVDEVSMVDTSLMAQLLSAIPSQARLLLVGDYDQLPSVGPGTVLKDLLKLPFFQHHALETIFRQSKTSSIIANAHSVRQGDLFSLKHYKESDFFFLPEKDPLKIKQIIIDLVQTRLPKAYGYTVMDDIQVLTPQNKGDLGTVELNKVLQEVVNPQSFALDAMGNQFRLQDKVMQLKNNYVKGVFNGDIGVIISIDQTNETLSVRFDDVEVCYEFTECDELKCAYAATVHKFQGSEYPCIIMPIHMSHYKLLYRQLLYTAITRGKSLVILVGDPGALKIAIQKEDVSRRFTGLTV